MMEPVIPGSRPESEVAKRLLRGCQEVVMWTLPPSDTVLHLLSYVALTAQAMTAALAAGRRSMDWAGVCMLGCITALGGGTIRDVLLGHHPLAWVEQPRL